MENIRLYENTFIPQVGLGVFQTKDGQETFDAVTWALDAGYRHIDTAKIYRNEKSVGDAIIASELKREDIFITTKLWNQDIRDHRVADAFYESLERLQTDYVDLYLIHWPAEGYIDAWKEMEKLYQQGKIRAIGVSNLHQHHLEDLLKVATIKPMANQIESHPYFLNQQLITYCQTNGIPVEVWSPLGGTGGNVLQDPLLAKIGEKYHKSAAQVVIRWHIQRGVIVLPKSIHQNRIQQNIDVFDFTLTNQEMELINQLDRNTRVGADPDHFNF